jgi:hypothetical protein
VFGLALLLRERVVGDLPHKVLQEAVLAALGRPGVGLQREDLLAEQRLEQRLDLGFGQPRDARKTLLEERLAQNRPVLNHPSLVVRESVESRRDQGVQRLWHFER